MGFDMVAVRSMTGFGQASAETNEFRVTVELRGVNHRGSELRLRLPPDLGPWEARLRRRIAERVRRGRVDLQIAYAYADGADTRHTLNRPLLEQVLETARSVGTELGVSGELDLAALLSMPGMFKTEAPRLDPGDGAPEAVLRALDAALAAFEAERSREGEELRRDLLARAAALDGHVAGLRARAASVPAGLRDRLVARLAELDASLALDPARIAQEAAVLAERADVTEELVRLEGHMGQVRTLLERPDGEPLGKRLDFLLQEILRETNTVCSKAADLDLTRGALATKLEIEKMREQVQNLE